MKKNTMMRVASVLLVAVLLSTCAISGTFAKYVTSDSGSDTARVAKWGVTVTIAEDLNLFKDEYAKTDANISDDAIVNTVVVNSQESANLVAPGTEGSIEFSIAGTPEVAVKVDLVMEVTSDVIIPAGANVNGEILNAAYTPVVFTLKDQTSGQEIAKGTLTQIEAGLEALSDEYAANTTLDKTFVLSWEWAFSSDNDVNDAKDTYLGDVAANLIANPYTGTSTAINFNVSITVTQLN